MPQLSDRDGTYLLNLGEDENRFSLSWLSEMNRLLDQVAADAPAALVTTATGKFYSNGLDIGDFTSPPVLDPDYVRAVHGLLSRILTLPLPTVAALNGHAFGAGALLAIAHDYRVMRADRGYFCFPEVNIGIPFTSGMAALVQGKLTPAAARDSMLTGRRFGAEDAVAAGLVDAAVPEEQMLEHSLALAAASRPLHSPTLGKVKSIMFAPAIEALAILPAS